MEAQPERCELIFGGVQFFVQPCFDQRLAIDATQFRFAVQHRKHMLGKINVHAFQSWLLNLGVFHIKSE